MHCRRSRSRGSGSETIASGCSPRPSTSTGSTPRPGRAERLGDRLRRSVRPDGRANARAGRTSGRSHLRPRPRARGVESTTRLPKCSCICGRLGSRVSRVVRARSSHRPLPVCMSPGPIAAGCRWNVVDATGRPAHPRSSRAWAAAEILRSESGLHVLEHVDERSGRKSCGGSRSGPGRRGRAPARVRGAARRTSNVRRPHAHRGRRDSERRRPSLPTREVTARTRQRQGISNRTPRPRARRRLRSVLASQRRRNPSPSGSSGSSAKTCSPVRYALPSTSVTTAGRPATSASPTTRPRELRCRRCCR